MVPRVQVLQVRQEQQDPSVLLVLSVLARLVLQVLLEHPGEKQVQLVLQVRRVLELQVQREQ